MAIAREWHAGIVDISGSHQFLTIDLPVYFKLGQHFFEIQDNFLQLYINLILKLKLMRANFLKL